MLPKRSLNRKTDERRIVLRLISAQGTAFEEEEEQDSEVDPTKKRSITHFEPETGSLEDGHGKNVISLEEVNLKEDEEEERQYYVERCSFFGGRGGRYAEPITRFSPGDVAMAVVSAQMLLESLPAP